MEVGGAMRVFVDGKLSATKCSCELTRRHMSSCSECDATADHVASWCALVAIM